MTDYEWYEQRILSHETPSYKKVLEMFNNFTSIEIVQNPTKRKCEREDNDNLVEYFETVFSNEYGSITVRYYLDDESDDHPRTGRYSAVFEREDARLGVFIANSSKNGNTIHAYDGDRYYCLPNGYLTEKRSSLDGIDSFVGGIGYVGEEEDINEFFLNL